MATSQLRNTIYFATVIILMLTHIHAASINATDDLSEDRSFKSLDAGMYHIVLVVV